MQSLDFAIGSIFKLRVDKLAYHVTNTDHTLDTVFTRYRGFHGVHNAVLTVVNLAVHKCVGEVFDSWIGGDSLAFLVGQLVHLNLLYLGIDIGYRTRKKLSEVLSFVGAAGRLVAIRT